MVEKWLIHELTWLDLTWLLIFTWTRLLHQFSLAKTWLTVYRQLSSNTATGAYLAKTWPATIGICSVRFGDWWRCSRSLFFWNIPGGQFIAAHLFCLTPLPGKLTWDGCLRPKVTEMMIFCVFWRFSDFIILEVSWLFEERKRPFRTSRKSTRELAVNRQPGFRQWRLMELSSPRKNQ